MTKQWTLGLLLAVAGIGGYLAGTTVPAAQSQQPKEDVRSEYVSGNIDSDTALDIIEAAEKKAEDMGLRMNIAVVDTGGNLKAFLRMDDAWLGSIDIAIKKAKTARYFDMPTGDIGELSQPGGPLYMIEASNDGLITFPGGVPLRDDTGQIIGAIGVSGSTVENDHQVATAGADVLR